VTGTRAVQAVVFDLGGVLLRLRDPVKTFGLDLGPGIDEGQFQRRWLLSPAVREFERGAIDQEAFARAIVAELALPMDWPAFLERFDAWPEDLFPDALPLLDAIPAGTGRGLLSNTNALHWGRADVAGLLAGCFDRTFLSFETGLLKPDPEAFMQVPRGFDCEARAVLYFDDNPLNVDAARQAGMQAHLAACPGDAARVISGL
jgi:putative hydrolase of the HAD superfamily